MGCYRREVDIFDYSTTPPAHTKAMLAQGRMRLASAADQATGCALFGGGEVNTTHNDASGIVDIYCRDSDSDSSSWSIAELSARRYELSAASLEGKLIFAGGNGGDGHGDPTAGTRVDIMDARTHAWTTTELPTRRDRLGAASASYRGRPVVCFGGGGTGDGAAAVECLVVDAGKR